MESLDTLRETIDNIDEELTRLLEERLEIVLKVGHYKQKHNLPVLNKAREEAVIRKNVERLKNKRFNKAIEEIYINIMDVSKKLESEEE